MRPTHVAGDAFKVHGIEKGRALNAAKIDYVVGLIMGWIGGLVGEVSC